MKSHIVGMNGCVDIGLESLWLWGISHLSLKIQKILIEHESVMRTITSWNPHRLQCTISFTDPHTCFIGQHRVCSDSAHCIITKTSESSKAESSKTLNHSLRNEERPTSYIGLQGIQTITQRLTTFQKHHDSQWNPRVHCKVEWTIAIF